METRFHELEHESKMRFLKTHSHTSERCKVPRARAGRPPERVEHDAAQPSVGSSLGGLLSALRASRFLTPPPGQVDFEPPGTEDANLEAEAARALQEGSLSPSGRNRQHEGSSPHGERHEVGSQPHTG